MCPLTDTYNPPSALAVRPSVGPRIAGEAESTAATIGPYDSPSYWTCLAWEQQQQWVAGKVVRTASLPHPQGAGGDP